MGNQALNSDLRNVQEVDFDNKKLDPLIAKLWTFDQQDSMRYTSLDSNILQRSGDRFDKQFPTQCTIDKYSEENVGKTNADTFIYEQTACAGFTSGEKKIDILRQESVKQLRVLNNPNSTEFENVMHGKIAILTAALLSRHKGGESILDWVNYASKEEVEGEIPEIKRFKGVFSNVSMLFDDAETINFFVRQKPALLKSVLAALLEEVRAQSMKSMFKSTVQSLSNDVKVKQIRTLLHSVATHASADQQLKEISTRLILRFGYVFASAENLILAAELCKSLNVDIAYDLMPLLDKSEKIRQYVKPSTSGHGSPFQLIEERCMQGRVSYSGQSDQCTQLDVGICDNTAYYMFSPERGLFRGEMRESDQYWEDSTGCTEVKSTYKDVSMVNIDGQIYIRSSHLPNEPFAPIDIATKKIKEEYEPWTSEGNLLNFTDLEENKQVDGDEEQGIRTLRATLMHYHEDELWIIAPYYSNNKPKRMVIEVYQRQGQHFTRTQEIPLSKEDGSPWKGGQKNSAHAYYRKGMLHKNAETIIIWSGYRMHAFNRHTGQRIAKEHYSSTCHVMFYNPVVKGFNFLDCCCYSWNKMVRIVGYDPQNQTVAKQSKVEIPVMLDQIKQEISTQLKQVMLNKAKEEAAKETEEVKDGEEAKKVEPTIKPRSKPKSNNVRYLMGIDSDFTKDVSTDDTPVPPSIENAQEHYQAIIYSFVSVEANYRMQAAEYNEDNPPSGQNMAEFFKSEYSVYQSRDFFLMIMNTLKQHIQQSQGQLRQPSRQIKLMAMLHLLRASILSIKCMRMTLQQILKTEEIEQLQSLQPLLEIPSDASLQNKDPETLTKEEAYEINLAVLAASTSKTITQMSDTSSPEEKLASISSALNSSTPESASQSIAQLADKIALQRLFSEQSQLKELLPTLNGCCFTVNQSLKRVLQKAIRQKEFSTDLDNDFSKSTSLLQSKLSSELCSSYGDQLWMIQNYKSKATSPKPESMSDEEYNKAVSKYQGALNQLKNLDKIVYQAFINVSQHIKFQMNQLSQMIESIDTAAWTISELENLMRCLKSLFSRDSSILRTSMLFSLFFTSFEVDVTWLDEIAEGLKHILTAVNQTLLNIKSIRLDSSPIHSLDEDPFVDYLSNVLRQISYTTGWISGRLIQQKQEQGEDNTLSKLNILQGGIENRFIPGLSEATKIQIEGSFKITGDKELQKLALSDAQSIVLESDDELLRDIINDADSVKLTLDVLQQALLTKIPMCAFARLGGQDGSKISRAAFAVMVKFSQSELDFTSLNNQIAQFEAMDGIAQTENGNNSQKLTEIIKKLKESKNQEFDAFLKRWENASQMRKWTQQIKLNISERTAFEAEQAFRKEFNEANPSADPLTGPLNEEQKRIVDERGNKNFEEELKKTYQEVVKKAEILIKLQVPTAYKAMKSINQQGRLQNQQSMAAQQKLQEETNLHIMIQQQTDSQDKEYAWTDRLKQWKKVQLAEGAIVDLSSKKQLNSQSASIAVLGLLQSEFSYEKICETIENSLIIGLRRSAGLNLLNHALSLHGNGKVFFDMIQWFSASLRQKQQASAHFLDGLSGCGDSCESGIRAQFFKIIDKVINKLKVCTDTTEMKLLLNVLCWNYKTSDHEELAKSGIFELLSQGNGYELNWVKYFFSNYQSHVYNRYVDDQEVRFLNLGRSLQFTCEYIQSQVLASIIETDAEVVSIESKQSQAKMIHTQSTLNDVAASNIFSQMNELVFKNIQRSLEVNRMVPSSHRVDTFYNSGSRAYNKSRNPSDYDSNQTMFENSDRTVPFDCSQQNEDIKTYKDLHEAMEKLHKKNKLKFDMLISKINTEQKNAGVQGALLEFLKQKAGPALGLRNITQIIEHVKARDLNIQNLLMKTDFEELGMTEPIEPKKEEQKEEEEKKDEENASENQEAQEAAPENQEADKNQNEQEQEEQKEEEKCSQLIKSINKIHEDFREKTTCEDNIFSERYGKQIDFVPQYRMLMQLEQLIGIAEKSPLVNSLLQDSLHTFKVKFLFEMAAQSHSQVQHLVQRILQTLLRMDLPHEIYESAIENCAMVDPRGLPTRLAKVLNVDGVLQFRESKFLQLLCNLIQEPHETKVIKDNFLNGDSWQVATEISRTLRILQTHPSKNRALSQMFKNSLKEAILSIDTKTSAGVETLFYIMGETRPLFIWSIGQPVKVDNKDFYTHLDNYNSWYQKLMLYCDPSDAKTQTFVDLSKSQDDDQNGFTYKCEPLLDMKKEETEEAAKQSIFMDPEVISKMISLLQDGSGKKLAPITARVLESSISRGFMNMFQILKLDYVDLLSQHDLFNRLMSYFVTVSGRSSVRLDEQSAMAIDQIQKDMDISGWTQMMTNNYINNNLEMVTCIYEDEEQQQALISIAHIDYSRKPLSMKYEYQYVKYLYRSHKVDDKEYDHYGTSYAMIRTRKPEFFDLMNIDDYDHSKRFQQSMNSMIDSESLKQLSFSTFMTLIISKSVITDDQIPVEELLEGIKHALNEKQIPLEIVRAYDGAKMPQIIVIKKSDFDRLLASSSTGLYNQSESFDTQDERETVLNEIIRRIMLKENRTSRNSIEEKALAKVLLGLTEKKSEQELLQLILDQRGDLENQSSNLEQILEDYKNGVPFQAPPTEQQVLKTKKTLASGIGAFFKSKQPASAVPDFISIFTSNERAIEHAQLKLKEQIYDHNDDLCSQRDFFSYRRKVEQLDNDFYCDCLETYGEYYNDLKVSNEAICRKALLQILNSAGNKLTETSMKLLNQEDMMTKLDDLIHNEHMNCSHQSIRWGNKNAITESENRIKQVLNLLSQSQPIKQFLVDDFFKRAKETITAFMKMSDDRSLYTDQDYITLIENWRDIHKLEESLDPVNAILLSKEFIEKKFIADEQLPESLIGFFDINLIYSTILLKNKVGFIREDLLNHLIYLTEKITENLQLFRGKTELLTKLLTNQLLKALLSKIDSSKLKEKSFQKEQIYIEIALAISQLQEKINQDLGEKIEMDLDYPQELGKIFSSILQLRDGTNFSQYMDKIKFMILKNANDQQVSHFASSYQTVEKRFQTQINSQLSARDSDWKLEIEKLTGPDFIKVSTDDGSMLMVDNDSIKAGLKSSIICKAGSKVDITYPVGPSQAMWTGMLKSRHGNSNAMQKLDGFEKIQQSIIPCPTRVLGTSNHLTYVCADGSIYGIGSRVQKQSYGMPDEKELLRKLDFPSGLSFSNIKKIDIGKFSRQILTNDGRIFYNGQHRRYQLGHDAESGEQTYEGFYEQRENFFRNGSDKIVDFVSGKHYNFMLTESGKVIGMGYVFYRQFSSDIKHNEENSEDYPFTIEAPEGFTKAVKAFPNYKMNTVYVNWQDGEGKIRSFHIGESDHDDSIENHGKWTQYNIENDGYFEQISATRRSTFAICNQGKLWVWGCQGDLEDTIFKNDSNDCMKDREWKRPCHFKWFSDKNLKVLEVKTGMYLAIVLTKNEEGKKELYGIGKFIANNYNGNSSEDIYTFGKDAKKVYGDDHMGIYQITEVDAEQVADFALTYNAAAYILKGKDYKQKSIIPTNPDASGLIHFYKKDGNWAFIAQEEYEEKKDQLPKLCFATRQPILEFSERNFPDLQALENAVQCDAEGEPQYFAKFTYNDENDKIFQLHSSEEQARMGSEAYDMNPVIFIRTSHPSANALDILPTIKLTDYFTQAAEDEQVVFVLSKAKLTKEDYDALEIRDEESKKFLNDLKNMTPQEDSQLVEQLDKIARSKCKSVTQLTPMTIQPNEFTWGSENAMAKKDDKLIKLRCKLLIKFVKAWQTLEAQCSLIGKENPGSIANLLFKSKYLIPSEVLGRIVNKACDQVDSSYESNVSVSRLRAKAFADSGKIDHEGKYTMFGQIIQQLHSDRQDLSNFRQKSTDSKCYSISFKGEGSIDAGGPFRDSLTNIAAELESGVVPLLIRSPNNKNEHGTNRECFILDSRSKTPEHKLMFKFFGAFLAFAFLSKSPVPFNLAPWVWKQILQEKMTMHDLEGIDAYSAQVLRDMQQYAHTLSDEEFQYGVDQNFTTVLSCGDEVPICPDGENIQVTKENISDFVQKVLEVREKEAEEQVQVIREGFLKVIQNKTDILDFLDWQTLERRCTGEKTIDPERLKAITVYESCSSSDEIVTRFWRVFNAFNDAERAGYLKFVWGRSRLPIDTSNLNYKHKINLCSRMDNGAFPQAHTCFFTIDMPQYETDEMMSNRLRVASELCGEMDTDNNATEDLD